MENVAHETEKAISGALWSVGLLGSAKSTRETLISQNQMCAKLRTLPFNVEPDSLNARRKLRTTNMVEFQNKELKKRTRCIRVFPNKESLLRIATVLLIELDEKWLANGKVYLKGWRQRFGEFTEKNVT